MNKSSLASCGAWPPFEDGHGARPAAQQGAAIKSPATGLPWLDSAIRSSERLEALPTSPERRTLPAGSSVLLFAAEAVLACVRSAQRVTTGRALLDLLEERRARVAGILEDLRANDPEAIARLQDGLENLSAWTAVPETPVDTILDAGFLRLAACDEIEGPNAADFEDFHDLAEVAKLVSAVLALDPMSSRRAPASQPVESTRIAMEVYALLGAHTSYPPETEAIAILRAAIAAEALRDDRPSIGHITLFAVAVLQRCVAVRGMDLDGWRRLGTPTRLGRPGGSR